MDALFPIYEQNEVAGERLDALKPSTQVAPEGFALKLPDAGLDSSGSLHNTSLAYSQQPMTEFSLGVTGSGPSAFALSGALSNTFHPDFNPEVFKVHDQDLSNIAVSSAKLDLESSKTEEAKEEKGAFARTAEDKNARSIYSIAGLGPRYDSLYSLPDPMVAAEQDGSNEGVMDNQVLATLARTLNSPLPPDVLNALSKNAAPEILELLACGIHTAGDQLQLAVGQFPGIDPELMKLAGLEFPETKKA